MSQSLTIQSVEQELNAIGPRIAAMLPPDVSPEKFRQVVMAAIRQRPDLLRCTRQSLFNACLNAAQDGLLPDGREGAIVPRKGSAVWQPMVGGIYKRVKTSGSVASLSANVVYDGEEFAVLLGDEDRIVHRRDMAKVAKGAEVAVYAIATLKDGTKEREVMSWQQVEDVRKVSASPNSGPWVEWPDEMARKTVVRRLAKRLPVLDPADEALQRTIGRVDALYDFDKEKPDLDTPAATRRGVNISLSTESARERLSREIPIDAPKQEQHRATRQTETKPPPKDHDESIRDDVVAGYAAVTTREEYLKETDACRLTIDYFREKRPAFYEPIAKAMAAAWDRTAPPKDELPEVEIVGEAKVFAG